MRILIVEDEVRLASTLADILAQAHYLTDVCHDGVSGLDNALSGIYDGVILDVMLPKLDGFQVVRRLREEGCHVPVLMLTARTELSDRVSGLDQGADYYLTKPFETPELLACLRALLRRPGEVRPEDCPKFGDLELDMACGALRREGKSTRLSARELALMQILLSNGSAIVPKETLLLKVWGYDSEAEANTVEVYISFLRKKLQYLHSQVQIAAVRRLGYHLKDGTA
ncbi:MAG: response regulator transcription factor [Oscillospiraceae bacterium]|nr:response regulator transcription factor [Oscillospiraceae bacterium]